MAQVNIHEAKSQLSKLVRRAAAGEDVVIALAGRPVARLVPVEAALPRQFGVDRGVFEVPADFCAALPAALLKAFEG